MQTNSEHSMQHKGFSICCAPSRNSSACFSKSLNRTHMKDTTMLTNKKEKLMGTIASELWLRNCDDASLDVDDDEEYLRIPKNEKARKPTPTSLSPTVADLFYARINGEDIDSCGLGSPDLMGLTEHSSDDYNSMIDNGDGQDALDHGEEAEFGGEDQSSAELNSFAMLGFGSDVDPEKPTSISTFASSRSGTNTEDEEEDSGIKLSVREIQQYVKKHMSKQFQADIPDEVWDFMFNNSSADKTRRLKSSQVYDSEDSEQEEDDDKQTVVSAITEATEYCKAPQDQHETSTLIQTPISTPLATTKNKKSKPTKTVSFGEISLRLYERILDINPAVTSGAALGIGWRYKQGGTLPVEDWEFRRRYSRRSSNELILPRHVRETIFIEELGYSMKQVASATRSIRRCKERRRVTVENLNLPGVERLEERVENASRAIKGMLSLGQRKGLIKTPKSKRRS